MPKFLRVNDCLHHVRFRPGNGTQPVVFANSLGTDLRIWDEVIAMLPHEVPVLTYDMAGHGLSQVGAVTIQGFAADLAAIMDAFDIRDAIICGVSVGGMIAQALAVRRPDLVASLLLCNTSHRIGTEESWADRIAELDEAGLRNMSDGILQRWFAVSFRDQFPDLVSGFQLMLERTPADGYRNVCTAIRDADLEAAARRIACPTLCISGSEDQATPPDTVRALAELIPSADHTCLQGVGHLPCIEAPGMLADLLSNRLRALA